MTVLIETALFTGAVLIRNATDEVQFKVENGYITESSKTGINFNGGYGLSFVDRFQIGELPAKDEYIFHQFDEVLNVTVAYDCNNGSNITYVTYPTPESWYGNSQYQLACQLETSYLKAEKVIFTFPNGEVVEYHLACSI